MIRERINERYNLEVKSETCIKYIINKYNFVEKFPKTAKD